MGRMNKQPRLRSASKAAEAIGEGVSVRRGVAADAEALTALAIRSKAHWGYSEATMRLFRPELVVTEAYLSTAPVLVAEANRQIVGFASLSVDGASPELVHLFVEPEFIGKGCGTILWQNAVAVARAMKWESFLIVAEPNAENFYLKRGATRIGEHVSSVLPGRKLPLLKYRL